MTTNKPEVLGYATSEGVHKSLSMAELLRLTRELPEPLIRLSDYEALKAKCERLTANPADHRYWEGRYRDKDTENTQLWAECEKLRGMLCKVAAAVGASANPDCSLEFMGEIPAGVAMVVSKLRKAVAAVQGLIDHSSGVAGLHQNGDVAPWHDLRQGGAFESWLTDFDDAI